MNAQYKDSVTTDGAGYKKQNGADMDYAAGSPAEMGVNNLYSTTNMAYPAASVPTPDNSKRKTDSSQLSPNQDSPANVGNSCC